MSAAPEAGRLVKSSAVRSVQVTTLPGTGRPVVVKEYRTKGFWAFLRGLVRGRPAARERKIFLHLQRAGVSVPQVVELEKTGFHSKEKNRFLALTAVKGAATVEDLLLGKKPLPAPRRILIEKLGRLVRAMHDAGVVHTDLHSANILVSPEGELFLIDFHSARIKKSGLGLAGRFRDLASLAGSFLVHGRRTDRLRFYRTYCRGLVKAAQIKKGARRLENASRARLRRFLAGFDKRPLREGRDFEKIRLHGWCGMGESLARVDDPARFLGPQPEELLREKGTLIKDEPRSSVFRLSIEGKGYIAKIYRRPGPGGILKRLFCGPKARAAWANGYRLIHRGLNAPRPDLFLAESPASLSGRSLVVFEEAQGLPTLDRFVEKADPPSRRKAYHRLARALARMHDLFLSNRDLKAQNIMIDADGDPVFLDPDGAAPLRGVGLDTTARDLMRLNASFSEGGPVSNTDRLRFLRTYARARRLPPEKARRLRLEILHLTLAKWRKWAAPAGRLRR